MRDRRHDSNIQSVRTGIEDACICKSFCRPHTRSEVLADLANRPRSVLCTVLDRLARARIFAILADDSAGMPPTNTIGGARRRRAMGAISACADGSVSSNLRREYSVLENGLGSI